MMKKIPLNLFVILLVFSSPICFAYAGSGGASVPVKAIELTEQGKNYTMLPTRLRFNFNGSVRAIQLRYVGISSATFFVMTLDESRPDDVLSYTFDGSFSLDPKEEEKVDIDKDGTEDVLVKLYGVWGNSASFSIKKIVAKNPVIIPDNEDNVIEEPTKEKDNKSESTVEEIPSGEEPNDDNEIIVVQEEETPTAVSEQSGIKEELTNPTFFEKIISFFKGWFW